MFGLEVLEIVPLLLYVCVLMCEPIDLHCSFPVALRVGQNT